MQTPGPGQRQLNPTSALAQRAKRAAQTHHNTTQLRAQLRSTPTQLQLPARAKRARPRLKSKATSTATSTAFVLSSLYKTLLLNYYDVSFESALSPIPLRRLTGEGKEGVSERLTK